MMPQRAKNHKHTSRKGQIIGHVFVFIIGLFVISAIILLGYRAVDTLRIQQCAAQEQEFTGILQDAISNNLARGKVRTVQVTMPCEVDQVCFVSRSVVDTPGSWDTSNDGQGLATIGVSVNSGEQTNVFVRRNGFYEPVTAFSQAAPIADTPNGWITPGVVCIEGESPEIRLQGTGQSVAVSMP